jgi:hypothetical protein
MSFVAVQEEGNRGLSLNTDDPAMDLCRTSFAVTYRVLYSLTERVDIYAYASLLCPPADQTRPGRGDWADHSILTPVNLGSPAR